MTDFNFKNSIKLTGKYTITRIKASTNEVVEELTFDNLITTLGIDRIGVSTWGSSTYDGWLCSYAYVSTNNAAPSVSDTQMTNLIGSTYDRQSTTFTGSGSGNGSRTVTIRFRFAAGTATGTIASVGVGWFSNSVNGLFSRALVKDIGGNPTTITVLSDEILDLTYSITFNFPPESTGTIVLNGNTYNWTLRPANVNSPWASGSSPIGSTGGGTIRPPVAYLSRATAYYGTVSLGTITGSPSGTAMTRATSSNAPVSVYDSNTKTLTMALGAQLNDWNTGSIGAIAFASSTSPTYGAYSSADGFMHYQIGFTPSIPKTSTQVLTLNFAFTFSN